MSSMDNGWALYDISSILQLVLQGISMLLLAASAIVAVVRGDHRFAGQAIRFQAIAVFIVGSVLVFVSRFLYHLFPLALGEAVNFIMNYLDFVGTMFIGLEACHLFEIYVSNNIPEHRRSLVFSFIGWLVPLLPMLILQLVSCLAFECSSTNTSAILDIVLAIVAVLIFISLLIVILVMKGKTAAARGIAAPAIILGSILFVYVFVLGLSAAEDYRIGLHFLLSILHGTRYGLVGIVYMVTKVIPMKSEEYNKM